MSGTRIGGKAAAKTNKEQYGDDFYKINGAKGGKIGRTGGTYNNSAWASEIGSIGGKVSKRGHKFIEQKDGFNYYLEKSSGMVVKYKAKGDK